MINKQTHGKQAVDCSEDEDQHAKCGVPTQPEREAALVPFPAKVSPLKTIPQCWRLQRNKYCHDTGG